VLIEPVPLGCSAILPDRLTRTPAPVQYKFEAAASGKGATGLGESGCSERVRHRDEVRLGPYVWRKTLTIKAIVREKCESCSLRASVGCPVMEIAHTDAIRLDEGGFPFIAYPGDCDCCFICQLDCLAVRHSVCSNGTALPCHLLDRRYRTEAMRTSQPSPALLRKGRGRWAVDNS